MTRSLARCVTRDDDKADDENAWQDQRQESVARLMARLWQGCGKAHGKDNVKEAWGRGVEDGVRVHLAGVDAQLIRHEKSLSPNAAVVRANITHPG